MKKYIVFIDSEGTKPRIFEAEEDKSYDNRELSLLGLMLACIFDKKFRFFFKETIKYALRHCEAYRGDGASEVYLMRCQRGFGYIWKRENCI